MESISDIAEYLPTLLLLLLLGKDNANGIGRVVCVTGIVVDVAMSDGKAIISGILRLFVGMVEKVGSKKTDIVLE